MNVRSTLILLAVAVLVGLLILVDSTKPPKDDRPSTSVFRDVQDDAIRSIDIAVGDRTVRLEKRTEAAEPWWEIVKPLKAPADKQAVTSLLSDLRWLYFKGFVEEAEAKARGDANYGLDKPQATLTCTSPGKTWALTFGGPSPVKDDEVFVRAAGQPGVYVVDKRLLDSLRKPPEELQDRTLVSIESWKADKLALVVGGEEVEIVKKDADWHIEKPEEIREKAEYTPVNKLLNDLRDIRWKQWVAEKPSDEELAKTYGLKPPAFRYAVSSTEAKKTEAVLLGGSVPRDEKNPDAPALVYVRKGDDGPVVAVESAALEKLPRRVDLLRTKKIWTMAASDLATIEVRTGGDAAVVEKPKDAADWAYAKPAGLKADGALVGEFVTALTGTEIEEFYERKMADPKTYGFDAPAAWLGLGLRKTETVTTGEGDKKETKSVEKVEPHVWLFGEAGGRVYVKREDRGQVVEIKPDLLKKIRLGALLFRSKVLVHAQPGDLQSLKVERMERGRADYATYACARKDGQWVLEAPGGAAIDAQKVNAAVGALHNLRALEWIAAAAPADAYGLGKPTVRVSFAWTETREVPKAKPAEEKKADAPQPEGAKGEAAAPGAAAPAGDPKPAAAPEANQGEPVKPADSKPPEVEKVTTSHAKVLLVGDPTKAKDAFFCRFEGEPEVFTLAKSTVDLLDQDLTKKAD